MVRVVVAEKPSVARDIARVLGATTRGDGFLSGHGYTVTWALGHLVRLAQPHEIQPEWKTWRRDALPMLPQTWPLPVVERTKSQFAVVRKLINRRDTQEVICATDAGREGELIFRYIYEGARCRKPVKRLWISSLTPEAIRRGFRALKPGAAYDDLGDAARARSRADWLVGLNLSRAYSLTHDDTLSVGRVQTPTLAILVERERAIREFVPQDYTEVEATFVAGAPYKGTYERAKNDNRLPADGKEAARVVKRAKSGRARVARLHQQRRRMLPPLLYDLTELQRDGNRLYGFRAEATLKLAQALYEKHKAISYPRTDSRHLSKEAATTLPSVISAITGRYRDIVAEGTGRRPLTSRFVNDAKVTDHHAIIPTSVAPRGLSGDEERIYDLICRRLLAAWHVDHEWAVTTVLTEITNEPGRGASSIVDRYRSAGSAVVEIGWRITDARPRRGEHSLPSGLREGLAVDVKNAEVLTKQTRPPPALTDATLLTAMESAGKTVDDEELARAMRECGLGTPATRAAIIETLLFRGYVERRQKALRATDKGLHLISVVHERVKSPALTGEWERRLAEIADGRSSFDTFMAGIEGFVREVVTEVAKAQPVASRSGPRRVKSRVKRRAEVTARPRKTAAAPQRKKKKGKTSRRKPTRKTTR